ncbi:TSUP family transporter [Nitriliruptoraceae bacterium ZYF776]|nr:TSUP family transporter [Profundirhabdus halotolerans]
MAVGDVRRRSGAGRSVRATAAGRGLRVDLLGQLAATGLDTPFTILGAVAAFVVAGAAAGASGFGVVLVAAPLLAIVAPGTLPGAVMPLSFATNLTIVAAEGRHADGRAVRRFLAAGVVGVPVGAALTVAVGPDRVGLVIAVVVAAATVAVWVAPPLPPGRPFDLAAGFVGGVSGGASGVTGPPVALRLAGGDPPRVRATLAVFFCLVNVVSRIHHGPSSRVEDDLFEAWSADARDPSRVVSMIVSTNDQAARLGERARQARLATGQVGAGATVQLRDNPASVGDHIVTRRNDRRLTDAAGQAWVVNGDVWTVVEIRDSGGVVARRHHDDAHIELPADYLAEHAHLGYAITAHRAQGMTVDVAHALVGPDDTHQRLYVAATRGRTSNHLWVTTDPPAPVEGALPEAPTPEQVLDLILTRRDLD